MANELAAKLQKVNQRIEIAEQGGDLPPLEQKSFEIFNPYTEFKEFTRKQIQAYQKMFNELVIQMPFFSFFIKKIVHKSTVIFSSFLLF